MYSAAEGSSITTVLLTELSSPHTSLCCRYIPHTVLLKNGRRPKSHQTPQEAPSFLILFFFPSLFFLLVQLVHANVMCLTTAAFKQFMTPIFWSLVFYYHRGAGVVRWGGVGMRPGPE